jgi:4-amino-4-deoxy-L-arabinose transferase-like glycosyltransferase
MSSKNNNKITGKHILIILAAFCLLATLLLVKIIHYHGFVPDWDESHHLEMGFKYFEAFNSHNVNSVVKIFTDSGQLYPPLYHILISMGYKIVGVSSIAGVIANIPFILILMLSVYGLGVHFGNRKAGFLAALLTPLLPAFVTLQERVMIDYTSISMFVFSFYVLFKTEGFMNRKYSILFGLSIFFDLLVKWPFVVPGIPFIIYACYSFYTHEAKRKAIVSNVLIALIISFLGTVWYFYNYKYMIFYLNFFWNPNGFAQAIWANPHGFTIQNILLYLFTFPAQWEGVGVLVLPFFYVALFIPKKNHEVNFLVTSVIITYLVLTYLNDKSEFYIAYSYPLMMLITYLSLFNIRQRFVRILSVSVLSGIILINFAFIQLDYINYKQVIVKIGSDYAAILPNYNTKFAFGTWPTKDIVKNYLARATCPNGVLVFTDNRFVNVSNIGYYLAINHAGFYDVPAYHYYDPATDTTFDIKYLETYDCVVSQTGDPGTFANKNVVTDINNYLKSKPDFKLTTFEAPDGSSIFLFIKNE